MRASPLPRRVLAIDYGTRRVGIAVSDPTGTLATPVTTLSRRIGRRPPITRIMELASDHAAEAFVVGLPLDGDGSETEWSAEVMAFGQKLGMRSGMPVHFADERYSSVEAEARIRSIGLRRKAKEDKTRIDAGAAAVFLQDWLDARSAHASADSDQGPEEPANP